MRSNPGTVSLTVGSCSRWGPTPEAGDPGDTAEIIGVDFAVQSQGVGSAADPLAGGFANAG